MKIEISFDLDYEDHKYFEAWLEKATRQIRASDYVSNFEVNTYE